MPEPLLLFTAGPVRMSAETLALGAVQPPYFRTGEYSAFMLAAEERFLKLLHAPQGSRAVFLSCSGTGAMEAAVSGTLTPDDRALIVNGGTFGRRFAELAAFHHIPAREIGLSTGEALTETALDAADATGATALLVNLHETSTGALYDWKLLRRFCDRHDLLLIVDAVSSFIADELDMSAARADVVLTASQKALACAAGIAPVALSPRALERVERISQPGYYLNLRAALQNGRRGQPPFTPAQSVMAQVAARLEALDHGGMERERAAMARQAAAFRQNVAAFPFRLVAQTPSNAVTALYTRPETSAYKIFETLANEYRICVCPNGGEQRDAIFRVGHMGALTDADYAELFAAFADMRRRDLI